LSWQYASNSVPLLPWQTVMTKNKIPINDLHGVVTNWGGFDKWGKGNVHFSGAVYSKLAEQIAEVISAQLELQRAR
jgi:lysophospholipase L1-like esterase